MNIGSLDLLLPAAKAGDKAGLNQLCTELDAYLKLVRIPDYHFHGYEKEDLIQDTIRIVIEKLITIEKGLKAFAYQVMRNLAGNLLRHEYGRKNREAEKAMPIIDEHGRVRDGDDLRPIVSRLNADFDLKSSEDVTSSSNVNSILKLLDDVKKICKLYFLAIIENCTDNLYSVYQQLNPGRSKNAYYVQLNRCRESFKLVLKREDLI